MASFFRRGGGGGGGGAAASDPSGSSSLPKPSAEHVAGASLGKSALEDSESLDALAELALRDSQTWSKCPSDSFSMRVGPKYAKNKLKAPAPPALLEVMGVDFFSCDSRIDNIASLVKIPDEWTAGRDTANPNVPPLFVANFQFPADFSSSMFKTVDNGPGWSLVFYFRLTEEMVGYVNDPKKGPGAAKLFAEYCLHAPEACGPDVSASSVWKNKFKVSTRCENIDQFGLPSFITSYNAKPVIIRNTGTVLRGEKYIEMDINIHKFSSVPKKALEVLFNKFNQMFVSIGLCIESEEDAEMPEMLFGVITLNKIGPDKSVKW